MTDDPNVPDGTSDGLSPAERAHLAGEPNRLPPEWCFKCEAEVVPRGKGLCPRCGRALKHSFLARRHPVNKLRRQQLLDKLVADCRPTTTMLTSTCEMLAGILEQLEVLKPGSPEHGRLLQLSQLLGASLDATRPRDPSTADDSIMTVRRILVRPEEEVSPGLEDRRSNTPMNSGSFGVEDPVVKNPPDPSVSAVPDVNSPVLDVGLSGPLETIDPSKTSTPTGTIAVSGASGPSCRYCHQPLTRCAELQATQIENWRALHFYDPAEVDRRATEATQTMLATMKHGSGITRW